MDKKTMEKVINGMADKIELLEDKIKHNAKNIDTIHDNTNDNLEEISENKFKIDDRVKFAQIQAGKIQKLELKNKQFEVLVDMKIADKVVPLNDKIDNKIKTLIKKSESSFVYTDNYEDDIKKLENHLNNKMKSLEITSGIIAKDRYDDLEAKNYQLRRELDGIYKVLEMDACDIQKLQDKMEGK